MGAADRAAVRTLVFARGRSRASGTAIDMNERIAGDRAVRPRAPTCYGRDFFDIGIGLDTLILFAFLFALLGVGVAGAATAAGVAFSGGSSASYRFAPGRVPALRANIVHVGQPGELVGARLVGQGGGQAEAVLVVVTTEDQQAALRIEDVTAAKDLQIGVGGLGKCLARRRGRVPQPRHGVGVLGVLGVLDGAVEEQELARRQKGAVNRHHRRVDRFAPLPKARGVAGETGDDAGQVVTGRLHRRCGP